MLSANNWLVCPLHHCQTEDLIRYRDRFVSFKRFSRISRVSSDTVNSCTTIRPSALLSEALNQSITDYNTQIRKFCDVGNLEMAMELFLQSQNSNLELDTYCSVLQLCADLKSLYNGRKIHSIIDSNGIDIEGVLGSKLVFMYVNCGDLRQGRRLFNKIANEKVFLWNFLINEYAKKGNHDESVNLYEQMQASGVKANSHTFSCVLKSFAAKRNVVEGERVHGHLLKQGLNAYITVGNSLITFYFRCGRAESACKMFDEMGDRDVITWNSMISGYVANSLADKGVVILIQMLYVGISVDLATMLSVLSACANIGIILLGRAVHAYAIKAGLNKEIAFNNALLDMYSKCDDINGATRVFQTMGERSVVSWTSMIAGYTRLGFSDKAIPLFHEMKTEGIEPDNFILTSILHAYACFGSLEEGRELHNYIEENNMDVSLSVSNALMNMYTKCGSVEDAHAIFTHMPIRDIVSWNVMIGGYMKHNLPNEAFILFIKMQQNLKPDNITMACILPGCASLAALNRGREIHCHILRNGFFKDIFVANALVDMYVKCGALVQARVLFSMIPIKDLISWTVMIAGYGMHGYGNEAIATFNEMREMGIEPGEVSFISILYACTHSGLVDEGWRFFNIMRNDCNIEPTLEHYACMVDLLAKSGKLSKAYRFVEIMPIKPDAKIWGILLGGCRIHHDVKLAERVAEHVFELEPENTGYYVLLANIYAEAEKWEEVKKLKEKIGRRSLKENPACSWIENKNKVQIFVDGDNSYPQAKKIESLLNKLRMKMRKEGNLLKLRLGLIDGDEMVMEVAFCGHSEKLAMAYGILNLPPGKVIRVTKNTRVCGDCHGMAKFMSRTVGKEIVLRDSNRFHYFKDGYCSCRG